MTYNYDEVYTSTLDYFNGDDLATQVWISKYAKSELQDDGTTLYYERTPDDMFHRIASEISRAGMKYNNPLSENEVYELIKDYKYILFAGRPMAGIGVDDAVSISNCFVVGRPGQDSYGTIATIDQEIMQLSKRGGGVGTDLSDYRPNGAKVHNAARTSSGPVEICANRFSNTIREVGQNGRRGALMLSMDITHPSAEEFMDAKMEDGKITGANISVKLYDDWMKSALGIDCEMDKEKNRLWKKIIHNATTKAEPGVLFWDTVLRESPADCYADYGFKTISTNPCVTGDTMVAVADGRGYVSIKQLADEGNDVPVYCLNNNDNLTVELMRNPRITGHAPIYKITLENGHEIKCTGNHKLKVNNIGYVEAKDLKIGDSMFLMSKYEANWKDIYKTNSNKGTNYYFVNTSNKSSLKPEHRYIYNYYNVDDPQVIHHANFDGLNNHPENLIGMTAKEHNEYHADRIKGENNPIHKVLADPDRAKIYKEHLSDAVSGLKNGNANPITNEEYLEHGIKLTKQLGRQITSQDWEIYTKANNLPMYSGYRQKTFGDIFNFFKICADANNISYLNYDARFIRRYYKCLSIDPTAFIKDNEIYVIKKCEYCGKEYEHLFDMREISFCSMTCANHYANSTTDCNIRRKNSIRKFYKEKADNNKIEQIKIYNELVVLGNTTEKKFHELCKERGVPHRFNTTFGFKNYNELKVAANSYNHKIINIEILPAEDVYNGTVDKYHNFFIGKFEETSEFGKPKYLSVNNKQCGEIPLAAGDACRLMSLNLYSYVIDPFTENARFDFDKFINHAKLSIKLMDNMIDLENEKIDRILSKIDGDPETDETKAVEKNLWIRVKHMNNFGRRSGIGFTALGDMLAALGLKYGTPEATEFVEYVQRIMATSVYIGSCDLVQVDNRPSFGCFNYELEKDNPFLNRISTHWNNNIPYCDNTIEDILAEEFYNKWNKGRRNIALLTCAPAGSLSTQSQTTSGLEPVFMISYRRRRKIDKNSGIKADFIDKTGDHFIEFNVVHNKFIEWYRITHEMTFNDAKTFLEGLSTDKLNDIIKQSPYFGATAMDCDWHERINMQAALQRYVDHSLSVTCNLPKGTSEEVVEDVYRTAWLSGCKGCTIYVDGCRDGVLINKEEKKCECNKFMESVSPKRPKKLPCQIVRFSNKGTKWIAAVGLYEDKPYEIFTGIAEKLEIPTNAKDTYIVRTKVNKEFVDEDTGEIITKKVSRYDIEYVDENGNVKVVEGLSSAFNPEYWNYAKLISGLFRHGMPPHYVAKVVESMDFKDEGINTWKNGIIRALKPFMKDEKTGDKCPKCGGELWRVSGCIQCPDCGWSKCG